MTNSASLTNHAEEQAAKTEALINQAAEYMFNNFRWKENISDIMEALALDQQDEFDSAIVAFIQMDSLTLRLMLEKEAMKICERNSKRIVAMHGEDWLAFLEGVDYE